MEKKWLLIIIVSFGAILTLFFFIAISLILWNFVLTNHSSSTQKRTEVMRYTEVSKTGQVKTGFAETSPLNTEYISYMNEDTGNFVIISPFGGSEYKCTGTCYCSNQESRRSGSLVSSTVMKGLVFLVTAFSTSTAINIAKETFTNQCEQRYSGLCDSTQIHAEVGDCEDEEGEGSITLEEYDENDPDLQAYMQPMTEADVEGEFVGFECHGHCVKFFERRIVSKNRGLSKDVVEDFDCELMTVGGFVHLWKENIFFNPQIFRRYDAKVAFQEQFLNEHCRRFSLVKFISENPDTKGEEMEIPLCTGTPELKKKIFGPHLRHIDCQDIDSPHLNPEKHGINPSIWKDD